MDVPECPGCRALLARNAELEARVLALEGQLRDLLNKLKPPQPPRPIALQPPAPAKKPTGKKPGGQPGHPPTMKTLVPPERVNHVVPYIPDRCGKCDEPLLSGSEYPRITPRWPNQGFTKSRIPVAH